MRYRLREIEMENKFCQELHVEAINRVLPTQEIKAALAAENVQASRVRKLNLLVTVLVIVGMSLYPYLSIGHVMQKIARGLRFIWPDPDYDLVKDSALSYRRYQLGAQVMVRLFRQICRPLATPETKGAFLFGLRMMAIVLFGFLQVTRSAASIVRPLRLPIQALCRCQKWYLNFYRNLTPRVFD